MRRPLALALALLIPSAGCVTSTPADDWRSGGAKAFASSEVVRPSARGDWRVGGAASGSFRNTDMGVFGDLREYGAELSIGGFVNPRLLLELALDANHFDYELEADNEFESSTFSGVAGFRYYFDHESRARPYLGIGAGVSTYDIDGTLTDDFGTVEFSDHDTSFLLVGRLGCEMFLSPSVTLDIGGRLTHVFDREVLGEKDDLTQGAILIGLGVWF